ncbi:DUF4234 domain-containing protein [Paenibacillus chibensis]|uniref:DUF4234 domain-containing protein n=1 Tax=Paenibacillus chibensis TaxID=59846 RepID=A0ABU6PUX0_9BACL|nr:DUF4234 domain-containing protein [Paenibacillus chibensis]MEC0371049.1 DUF4234 domain-containing protein [Paenibacillus chibensis]MED5018689.1 DUF4234 domain-containing protein [Paenibacillus chibensis]
MTQRNIVLAIILTLITCGLYGIYWFIVLTDEVGQLSGDPDFTGLKHFLLTLITCGIWGFIWAYQIGQHVAFAQSRRGLRATDNAILYVILNLFGLSIVTYAMVQNDVNNLV